MTTTSFSTPPLSAQTRRARVGVALFFLTNGALFANLLPRYPEIKSALDLTNTQFGLAVAAFPVGALVAGLAAGGLIRRFRSSRVALFGTVVTSAGVLLAGLAPTWALLAGALFLAGAMDSITDVAQNSHALRVQRLFGRSILNSFHAIWSVGAVLGGLMAGGAAALHLPLGEHLTISAILFIATAIVAYRLSLPGPEPLEVIPTDTDATETATLRSGRWAKYALLGALVVVALSGTIFEDAGNSWSALYLSGFLGSSAGVAAFGYVALTGAQFIGRILGDRLVDRFGQRAIARTGGAVAALGMGAALAFPSIPMTIVGFALVGLGSATLVPAAMHAADELPGFRAGTALTIVSWLMRVGFLISPLIVGMIADASSLRFGLLIVPAAGVLVVVFSGVLSRSRSAATVD
ncbi:MFS transporter [Glaciihabitans sp. dw_435]|uniref:MFS transporter n=1 Tax=Glaciihabitans sp. dw_435 TaxID=2720081 RepID=UPI001BD20137|nr:MFS transporter [Glaciihabitans sp. dw_435]